ncbi:hypothetical protein ACFQ3Y_08960 [Paenibacillus motobuensis]|uniref:hypothetical protein n=1 Tax=Paenibacillus motobuensis TaxID=295324 RepID=UPI003624E3CD
MNIDEDKIEQVLKEAKKGDVGAVWVIKSFFLRDIYRESSQMWRDVVDETEFEDSCFKKIEYIIKVFDPLKTNISFSNFVRWQIRGIKKEFLGRKSKKKINTIPIEEKTDCGVRTEENIFIDDLTVVEEEVMGREIVSLLTQGDYRRGLVLTSWMFGFTDATTQRLLTQQLGGKRATHKKYIQRLRTECQKALSDAV